MFRVRSRFSSRARLAGLFACVTAGALALLGAGAASSAPVIVNCNIGGNLQEAIDGAASGSTLLVTGTCHGTFSISGIELALQGWPVATLDGEGAGTTLALESSNVTLERLIVTGGSAPENSGGGGIAAFESTVTVGHSIVRGNAATLGSIGGGGILIIDSVATIDSSTVTKNTTDDGFGGGIAVVSSFLTLSNSSVTLNRARQIPNVQTSSQPAGGGLFAQSSTVTVESSVVSRNSAAAGGGLVNVGAPDGSGGEMTVSGSTIADNTVSGLTTPDGVGPFGGAGIVNVAVGDMGGEESTIALHRSSPRGAPSPSATPGQAALTITSTTLGGNLGQTSHGGGIQNIAFGDGADAAVVLSAASLRTNTAGYGGGIWSGATEGSVASVALGNRSAITGNVAQIAGGGIDNESGSTVSIGGGSAVGSNHPDNCLGC